MVRMERLELSRLATLEPKSSVYTNFTTSAYWGFAYQTVKQNFQDNFLIWLFTKRNGVADGDRTRDRRNHNPELYRLSYGHHYYYYITPRVGTPDRNRTCNPRLRRPMLYQIELRALHLLYLPIGLNKRLTTTWLSPDV